MIHTFLSVSLSLSQLCVMEYSNPEPLACYDVATGKPGYETPVGEFTVKNIYLNASLISPFSGENLGSEIIGSTLVDFGEPFSIHGWRTPVSPGKLSHSCIRMTTEDLKDVIWGYYFDRVVIVE